MPHEDREATSAEETIRTLREENERLNIVVSVQQQLLANAAERVTATHTHTTEVEQQLHDCRDILTGLEDE